MNFYLSEIDLKKNWPVAEALNWVEANRPSDEQANQLAEKILQSTILIGSNNFKNKTIKLIKKAAKMSTGAELFKRALALNRVIEIESDDYHTRYNVVNHKITLNFTEKSFFETLDDNYEVVFEKHPKVFSFLHELIHYVVDNDAKLFEINQNACHTIENMDNQWEEGTISGFLHLKNITIDRPINPEIYDFCCENTALLESGLLIRVHHHGGLFLKKNEFFSKKLLANGYINYLIKLYNLESTSKETKLEIAITLTLVDRVALLLNGDVQVSPKIYELISDNFTEEANQIREYLFQKHLIPSEQSLINSIVHKAPIETLLTLVDYGAAITGSVLAYAIVHHIDAAHHLLSKKNASPTTTTLSAALQKGEIDIANELVQTGIQLTSNMFETASIKGMEFLFDQGIQPTQEYLNQLVKFNNRDNLSFMLQRGVQLSESMISQINFISIAELFLDNGFQITETQAINLESAIMERSIKLIKHFIDTDVEVKSIHFMLADFHSDSEEILDLLRQGKVISD